MHKIFILSIILYLTKQAIQIEFTSFANFDYISRFADENRKATLWGFKKSECQDICDKDENCNSFVYRRESNDYKCEFMKTLATRSKMKAQSNVVILVKKLLPLRPPVITLANSGNTINVSWKTYLNSSLVKYSRFILNYTTDNWETSSTIIGL
jgi:hypothetical protein